ncbi:hypothetical protein ABT095_03845 [Kitasatospora sp. NPDC002227]|uniref:hypothetical protein n=1 Tax=Kitasatospora sp. NPDC002227 TaxID=3154773 RepID=UPI003329A54A
MVSLPRRAAAVALLAAGLLGFAGTATEASATTVRYFYGSGPNAGIATQHAWNLALAAGYTDSQCSSETDLIAPGYWKTTVTCVTG